MSTIILPQSAEPTFEDISISRLERHVRAVKRLLDASKIEEDEARLNAGKVLGAPDTTPRTRMPQDAREHVTLGLAQAVLQAEHLTLVAPTFVDFIDSKSEAARTGGPVRSPAGLTVIGKTALHEKAREQAELVGETLDDSIRDAATGAVFYLNTGMASLNHVYGGKESIMFTRGRMRKEERRELNANREAALKRIEESGNKSDAQAMSFMYGIGKVLSRVAGPDGYWQDEGWMTAGHRVAQLLLATKAASGVLNAKGIMDPAALDRRLSEIETGTQTETKEEPSRHADRGSLVQVYQTSDIAGHVLAGAVRDLSDRVLHVRGK